MAEALRRAALVSARPVATWQALVLGFALVLVLARTALAADAAPAGQDTAPAGRAVFEEKCAMCHRQGGMGTGLLARRYPKDPALLEERKNLNPDLIRAVVRHGIGNMPRISRAEVSDAQLTAIVSYLTQGAHG